MLRGAIGSLKDDLRMFIELLEDELFRSLVLFVLFVMLISLTVGWISSNQFNTWADRRNAVVEISIVKLSVVSKGADFQFMFGIPDRYYLSLSNGEKIYVSYEDFILYEEGHTYEFEQTEQQFVTRKIKPYIAHFE